MSKVEDKNPIQVAGRLFGALEFLADKGESGLCDIADGLGLNKSTTHRVLCSLEYMGYVLQNGENGKYKLSMKIVDMGNHIVDRMDINKMVRPYLRKLCDMTGETVHFVELEGSDIVYVDKEESDVNTVRMVSRIGSRIPFYRSAVGKAITAVMTNAEIKELWDSSSIKRMTPNTITNIKTFMNEISSIREKGYALDNEENEIGVRCIACSLSICGFKTKYAFSISAPISRMDDSRINELSEQLIETKKSIEKNVN